MGTGAPCHVDIRTFVGRASGSTFDRAMQTPAIAS